ncbi:MAG: hypothetical protein SVM79_07460, partial [Chloroflexota bacterium]|nr:hypothetical protein [Chloroflexota bacterium]
IDSFEAIQMLHDNGFCHGDIRNDHIVIDERTGKYRWIDFDLCQDFLGYDVCAIGNILQYVIGKGLNSYYEINKGGRFPASTISSLDKSDANAFYTYRIMNLKKLYPYISEQLSTILLRFSVGATENYATVSRIIQDLSEAIDEVPTN